MPELGSRTPSAVPASSLSLVAVGVALTVLGRTLDGFPKGLLLGGGVAMILIGVAVLSAHLRHAKDDGNDGLWLPSRDQDKS